MTLEGLAVVSGPPTGFGLATVPELARDGASAALFDVVPGRLVRAGQTEIGTTEALLPSMTLAHAELTMENVPARCQHADCMISELGLPIAEISRLRTHGVMQ